MKLNVTRTRSPSNLAQITRKSVHFRSRDKDGCHIIRSVIAENPPMLHANFTALSSIEPELLPSKFYTAGIGNFAPFCSCYLQLVPMTFIYEVDSYPPKIYPHFLHQGFRKLSY